MRAAILALLMTCLAGCVGAAAAEKACFPGLRPTSAEYLGEDGLVVGVVSKRDCVELSESAIDQEGVPCNVCF